MSTKKKVVILRQIPTVAEQLLSRYYQIDINRSGKVLTRKQLKRRVKGAAAIISLLTDYIDEEVVIAAGGQLKIVANYAVGYDNIEVAALNKHGVIVTNTPGQLTDSVAEHALALMLAVSRRLIEADEFVRAGKYKQWEPMLFYGQPLMGKTVGIIGAGRIGAAFAYMCHRGLRMRVLYHDQAINHALEREIGAKKVGLPNLLKSAEVISLHVPLLPSTKHLISATEFKQMKESAILINTARGPIINEEQLVKALESKRIFAAAIDVFEHEPKLTSGMRSLSNLIMTPHIASANQTARDMMAEMAARNVKTVLSGHPPINEVKV